MPRTEGLRFQERVFLCNTLTKVVQVFRAAFRKFQIYFMPIKSSEKPAIKRSVKLCFQKKRQVRTYWPLKIGGWPPIIIPTICEVSCFVVGSGIDDRTLLFTSRAACISGPWLGRRAPSVYARKFLVSNEAFRGTRSIVHRDRLWPNSRPACSKSKTAKVFTVCSSSTSGYVPFPWAGTEGCESTDSQEKSVCWVGKILGSLPLWAGRENDDNRLLAERGVLRAGLGASSLFLFLVPFSVIFSPKLLVATQEPGQSTSCSVMSSMRAEACKSFRNLSNSGDSFMASPAASQISSIIPNDAFSLSKSSLFLMPVHNAR